MSRRSSSRARPGVAAALPAWRWPAVQDVPWAALVTLVLVGLLLAGGGIWQHVGGADLHAFFLPKYEEAGRALRELRLPLWNPYEFCGAPLLAVIQGGFLYPPVPILFALLPPWFALQGLYAFHVLVLAWGTTLYLRQHGSGRGAAALAVIVTLAGTFTGPSHGGIDHPNFFASAVWIPLILLCWENAVRRGARPWLGLLALAGAAQWLGGYPDFALDTMVLLGLTALVSDVGPLPRRLTFAVLGLALAALLVSVQLLPASEAVAQSARTTYAAAYEGMRATFAEASLPAALLEAGVRFGPAALVLAAFALRKPDRAALAWLAALLWSVCALQPPFNLVYRLPIFAGIRFPYGWSHIAPVFLGLLIARGSTLGAQDRRRWVRVAGVALGLLTAALCARTIVRVPTSPPYSAPDQRQVAERVRLLAATLAARDGVRLISRGEGMAGALLRDRLPSPTGYDPSSPPQRTARLLSEMAQRPNWVPEPYTPVEQRPDLAALLGVGVVVVPQSSAPRLVKLGFTRVGALPGGDAMVARVPVPRARVVHRVYVETSEEASFARTIDRARDFRTSAVVESADPVPSVAEPPESALESVRIVAQEPERIDVDVDLAAAGLLVLTDTYYPGWEATLDGAPVPIVRADYAFRGAYVPAGRHRITFRFRPRIFVVGAGLTLLAGAIVAGLLVRRRQPRGAASARAIR